MSQTEELGASLLAGVQKRNDEQYEAYKKRQDEQDRKMRKREKRDILHTYAAKAAVNVLGGVANKALESATNNFMSQEQVIGKNIKVKEAYNGAAQREQQRAAANAFEGGADAYYQNLVSSEMGPTFAEATYGKSAAESAALIREETMQAALNLRKAYEDSQQGDRELLQLVGEDGGLAYEKALQSSRPANLGEAAYLKVKNLFRKDGDPLDNSILANKIFDKAENVKAFGEVRRLGMSPYKAKEYVENLNRKGASLNIGVVSTDIENFHMVDPDTLENVQVSGKRIILTDNTEIITDLNGNPLITSRGASSAQQAKQRQTLRPEYEENVISLRQNMVKKDAEVLSKYVKNVTGNTRDPKVAKANSDNVYAGILVTAKTVQDEFDIGPVQAKQIASRMHVLNIQNLSEAKLGGLTSEETLENNLLLGKNIYDPVVAALAIETLKGEDQLKRFPKRKLDLLVQDFLQNPDRYLNDVSESGRKTQAKMKKKIRAFQQVLNESKSEDEALAKVESKLTPKQRRQSVLDTIDSLKVPVDKAFADIASGGAGQGPLLNNQNPQQETLDISLPATPREFGDTYGRIVGEEEALRRNYYRDFPAIDKLVKEGMSLDEAIKEVTKPLVLKR
tara:strand:+ start:3487 stop:5355 length:1869 start_codon:yes stop_codon:yes gene_type:complete